mgnify:FL=1
MGMDSVVWLVAVVAFFILEAITTALVSVWFAVGAAVALIVSFFTTSVAIQFVVFALVSAVTLAIMVPLLAKHRGQNAPITNGARLSVGKRGIVLLAILPGEIGRVRVDGLDWQARADAALPKGARVEVTDVDGGVLVVHAVQEPQTTR